MIIHSEAARTIAYCKCPSCGSGLCEVRIIDQCPTNARKYTPEKCIHCPVCHHHRHEKTLRQQNNEVPL